MVIVGVKEKAAAQVQSHVHSTVTMSMAVKFGVNTPIVCLRDPEGPI